MNALPPGWAEAELTQLSGPGGFATDGDWIESKDQDPVGDVRLIQLMDIGDGEVRDRSRRFLTSARAGELDCTYLARGDLLIARMPDPLGRACIYPGVGQPAVTAVDVLIWRSGEGGADAHWLAATINSPDVRSVVARNASGTTRQRVAGGQLKKLSLPLPPLAEQRRIVAKIDALTARSKRARAELQDAQSLNSRVRAELLDSLYEDSDGAASDRLNLDGVVSEPIRNGLSVRGSDQPPGVRALRLSALRSDQIDLDEVRYLPITEARAKPFLLRQGDMLLSRGNGTLRLMGTASIVQALSQPTIFPDTAFRLRPDTDKIEPRWLLWLLKTPQVRSQIEARAKTTAGIWKISQADLREIEFPVPSIDEQRAIVARIETAFSALDRVEAEARAAERALDRLDQAVLAKAFRGELVPQDPADEPACELLARIAADRARAPKPSRGRRSTTP